MLNNNEVNMGLKDVAFISGLRIVTFAAFQPNASNDEPTFKERFFSGVKQVSYHETSRSIFGNRFIRRAMSGNKRINMSDFDFNR